MDSAHSLEQTAYLCPDIRVARLRGYLLLLVLTLYLLRFKIAPIRLLYKNLIIRLSEEISKAVDLLSISSGTRQKAVPQQFDG